MHELTLPTLFIHFFKLECQQFWRTRAQVFYLVVFYSMFVVILPLAYPQTLLATTHWLPGVLWSGILLSTFIYFEKVFLEDWQSGYCEQWLLMRVPMRLLIGAKIVALWCGVIVPLIVVGSALGAVMGMSLYSVSILALSMLTGTPIILVIGLLASALLLGVRAAHYLLPLLVMPLVIPIVILGAGMVTQAMGGQPFSALVAVILAALALSPWR